MPEYEQIIEKIMEREAAIKREREAEELRNRALEKARVPELSVDSILSKSYGDQTSQDIDFLMNIPEEQLAKLSPHQHNRISTILMQARIAYESLIRDRHRLVKIKEQMVALPAETKEIPSFDMSGT